MKSLVSASTDHLQLKTDNSLQSTPDAHSSAMVRKNEDIGLNALRPPEGSRSERRRVGRGVGSGRGKTCGRGAKGQKARSGGRIPPWFEGGQMPLQRRVPKRGFRRKPRERVAAINLQDLNRYPDRDEFTPEVFLELGLADRRDDRIKILAKGKLNRKVVVRAHAFSSAAREQIEAQGGKVEVL